MSSDSITPDSHSIELTLRDLQPVELDETFLSRLEAAADGSLLDLSSAELRFEESLKNFSPTGLSPEFLASLETAVAGTAFPLDEKILLFPKAAQQSRKPVHTGQRSLFAAAAAVALIGAATALLMPEKAVSTGFAKHSISPVASENIAPVLYNRGLSEAKDEGVIWQSKDKPQRVVRVVYMDRITTKNAEGKTVEIEQPRVEYILVPEKID